ncbi:tetratricopeptide repeat protein [Paenibacillus sp. 1001270B_150601_E10]|uniref:tetratricopeptide repeat protein n=1 Tax=Paenibacillus sp. 1001270B_150601_E10 TaxID=2787079 RepID=UPI001E443157|nr:tetratricopeptide repeat protein [Paenibacillus sp. 1001270B_150601_E10]
MADQMSESTGHNAMIHTNIISFPVDAAAYADRAIKALERMHYDKALKYFRKAADCEPSDPIHQCNYAGALAEAGQFEQSNRILDHVVNHLDPDMTECYYYMANNCAYLEKFDAAEALLEHYLTIDPTGIYVEEAQDMLDMLHFEKHQPGASRRGRGAKASRQDESMDALDDEDYVPTIEKRGDEQDVNRSEADEMPSVTNEGDEQELQHATARQMLEEGRFGEAEQLLLGILEADPDYLAARNNLALAYYYMGRFEDAQQMLHGVLERDAGNLHALCNLAIFERQAGHEDVVQEIVEVLTKTEPFHHEHSFKLATTMGILGEHQQAYRHLKRIVTTTSMREPSVYHYAAVAACHVGRYDEAARWWAVCRRLDTKSGIAAYFLEQLQSIRPGDTLTPMPSYHYRLPYDEESRRYQEALRRSGVASDNLHSHESTEGIRSQWQEKVKSDPLVRSSLFWALRFGDLDTKLQAIEAISVLGDEEAKEALKTLLLDPAQEPVVKQLSFYLLRRMGVEGELEVNQEGSSQRFDSMYLAKPLPVWETIWENVIEELRFHMEPHVSLLMMYDAEMLWYNWLAKMYPDIPRLQKTGVWAAALEYIIMRQHHRPISYQEAADRYEVSAASVSRNVKRLVEGSPVQGYRSFEQT